MKRKCIILLGLAIPALLVAAYIHADEASEKAVLCSATAWLALADGGKYPETWDQAAAYFKNALTKDRWVASLKGGRAGKLEEKVFHLDVSEISKGKTPGPSNILESGSHPRKIGRGECGLRNAVSRGRWF